VLHAFGNDSERDLFSACRRRTVFLQQLGNHDLELGDQLLECVRAGGSPGTSSLDAIQTLASPSHSALIV